MKKIKVQLFQKLYQKFNQNLLRYGILHSYLNLEKK